jgi:hypothetical protein
MSTTTQECTMPNDRKRNDDLDDITGRRQIISPRDSQSGLPSGVLPAEASRAERSRQALLRRHRV